MPSERSFPSHRTSTTVGLLLLCLSNHLSVAGEVRVDCTDDTFVRGGTHAETNHASAGRLLVESDDGEGGDDARIADLRFDLGEVSGNVTSAVLRLYGKHSNSKDDSASSSQLGAYEVDEINWAEKELTWSQRPPMGSLISSCNVEGREEMPGTNRRLF
jgi:hypothetical protein